MKNNKIIESNNLLSRKDSAFTLVEVMTGIIIVAIVIIGGFQALSAITIGKARLIQQTDIQKDSFYFTEKLFEMIKKGGTLDYEEYFNRKVIGNTTFGSGHFDIDSGFGNFGSGVTVPDNTTFGGEFYYCRSDDGTQMTGSGCVSSFNYPTDNYEGNQQRYGQYSFQFLDYNVNYDSDLGDEDGDGEIRWDDDDEYLGEGPVAFSGGVDLTELYLISGNKKERTLFRLNVSLDPHAPSTATCDTATVTGTGCIGTIEYLKLDGVDWGMDHDKSGDLYLDGVVDTWLINKDFVGGADVVAGTGNIDWVRLFPETVNITDFKIYAYPNIDINHAWKSTDPEYNISPYVILKLKLKPSWISRKKMKGEGKELEFSMTINLSEIYSN